MAPQQYQQHDTLTVDTIEARIAAVKAGRWRDRKIACLPELQVIKLWRLASHYSAPTDTLARTQARFWIVARVALFAELHRRGLVARARTYARDKAWAESVCCVCGDTAIYLVGLSGFCRFHERSARAARVASLRLHAERSAYIEASRKHRDYRDLSTR